MFALINIFLPATLTCLCTLKNQVFEDKSIKNYSSSVLIDKLNKILKISNTHNYCEYNNYRNIVRRI